jgi:hypothetical protein
MDARDSDASSWLERTAARRPEFRRKLMDRCDGQAIIRPQWRGTANTRILAARLQPS